MRPPEKPARRPIPRVLVTGAHGQLGRSLQILSKQCGNTARYFFADRHQLDITQNGDITHWLDQTEANCLINTAAYTAVDQAASETEQALAINAHAPGLIAQICASRRIRLLHISTDYVFDGQLNRPYRETDPAGPLNSYGHSKWLGEQAVLQACPWAVILRTSWVFSPWEPNFVHTMLRLGQQQSSLRVISDQTGGPTWAGHLAQVLHRLALLPEAVPGGLYHFAGKPWTSWYGFAHEIFQQAQYYGLLARAPQVQAVTSAEWPSPEPRPLNSRLDCSQLEARLGPLERDWRVGLTAVLNALQ